MDEMGRPLYGDVFGVDLQDVGTAVDEGKIDKSLWESWSRKKRRRRLGGESGPEQAQVCVSTCVHTINQLKKIQFCN